ncbi:hypothetical protein G6514_008818 [Epicoccum nigrum]|nr:hypothetical protein G6514_008818 [Epicoccum nigrum]
MYKLFRDVMLALNYLHNELGTRYVHSDFKPDNILAVIDPEDVDHHRIPEEPIFKLADFSRMTPWPTPAAAEEIPHMDEMVERLKLQRLKELSQDE